VSVSSNKKATRKTHEKMEDCQVEKAVLQVKKMTLILF